MSKKILAVAVVGALTIPVAAQAQGFKVPNVELFATVTGKWVLDPQRCKDIREDFRDAQRNEGRRDLREDRRDQRVADCPPEAYDFIVDAGQGPKHPVRVARGRIPRRYRRIELYRNGDNISGNRNQESTSDEIYSTVPQPTYVQPAQPTYVQPAQPTYQPAQPTYQPAQPTYQPAQPTYTTPAPAPAQPTYEIDANGIIRWLTQ